MNQNLFQTAPFVERSFFQKLFGQHPEENAVIELNNLLASKEIKQISQNEISNIETKYNVNLTDEFTLNIQEFFATYLNKCVRDRISESSEKENLNHLKQILKLSDTVVEDIYTKIGEGIYRVEYAKAIADGYLTIVKENELKELASELKLREESTEQLANMCRHNYMDNKILKISEDGKISPDEWQELTEAAKNLHVDIKIDEKTNTQIERLKLNWQIQEGELPVINPGLNLQKGENCHFSAPYVDWLEHRTVTKRINYGGPTFRVKIVKGVYYRAGSMAVNRVTSDLIQKIDSGTLYLTNKRVIFVGSKKNSNIRLDKILSVVPYTDGVELEKDTGKSPILRMATKADIFAMMISRLMNEN